MIRSTNVVSYVYPITLVQPRGLKRYLIMFCCIGVQRIFTFMDKMKQSTGDATVTYENPDASMRAIEMFNGKDFNGKGAIVVAIATPEQKQPFANKLVGRFRYNSRYYPYY